VNAFRIPVVSSSSGSKMDASQKVRPPEFLIAWKTVN
jgi:hypothetical protein